VAALAATVICFSGCGEGGVSDGATVNVYVSSSLCAEAKRELARHGGEAGALEVSAICLDDAEAGGRLDLAALGADARRVSEDSASVAYLEARGPGNRFSRPIVEAANIAYVTADSGAAAMSRLLDAIEDADTSSLRDSVRDALTQT
jgi:hypothetical protein